MSLQKIEKALSRKEVETEKQSDLASLSSSLPEPYNDARSKLLDFLKKAAKSGGAFQLKGSSYRKPVSKFLGKGKLLDDLEKVLTPPQNRSPQEFINLVNHFFDSIFLKCDSLSLEQIDQISGHVDEILGKCSDKQEKIFKWVTSGLVALLYHHGGEIGDVNFNPLISPSLQARIHTDSYKKLANKFVSFSKIGNTAFDFQKMVLNFYCRTFTAIFLSLFEHHQTDQPLIAKRKSYDKFITKLRMPDEDKVFGFILKKGPKILKKLAEDLENNEISFHLFFESISTGLIIPDVFKSQILFREAISYNISMGPKIILPELKEESAEGIAAVNFLSHQVILNLFGNKDNLKEVFLSWFVKVFFRAENVNIRGALLSDLNKPETVLPVSVMLNFFKSTYLFPHITQESSLKGEKKSVEEQKEAYLLYAKNYLEKAPDPLIKQLYDKAKKLVESYGNLGAYCTNSNETLVHRKPVSRRPSIIKLFETSSDESLERNSKENSRGNSEENSRRSLGKNSRKNSDVNPGSKFGPKSALKSRINSLRSGFFQSLTLNGNSSLEVSEPVLVADSTDKQKPQTPQRFLPGTPREKNEDHSDSVFTPK